MTRLTAAILVSMLSACVTESEEPTDFVTELDDVAQEATEAVVYPEAKPRTRDDVLDLDADITVSQLREPRCRLVSDTEGPCTLACAPDKLLEEYVPKSACVIFRCKLTTGDEMLLGGCNSDGERESIVRASP